MEFATRLLLELEKTGHMSTDDRGGRTYKVTDRDRKTESETEPEIQMKTETDIYMFCRGTRRVYRDHQTMFYSWYQNKYYSTNEWGMFLLITKYRYCG